MIEALSYDTSTALDESLQMPLQSAFGLSVVVVLLTFVRQPKVIIVRGAAT